MATMTVSPSRQLTIVLLMAAFSIAFCRLIDNPVSGKCNNGTDNSTDCRGTKRLKISHIVEEVPVEVVPIEPEPITNPTTKSPTRGGSVPIIYPHGSSSTTSSSSIVAPLSLRAVAQLITVTSCLFFVINV